MQTNQPFFTEALGVELPKGFNDWKQFKAYALEVVKGEENPDFFFLQPDPDTKARPKKLLRYYLSYIDLLMDELVCKVNLVCSIRPRQGRLFIVSGYL